MGEWRGSSNIFLMMLLGRKEWVAAYLATLFQGRALITLWVGVWVNSKPGHSGKEKNLLSLPGI
jgi:hypothetical protein